ncbi:MAG: sodium:calcium antiporter [Thermoanaerobacterales bacterium]|nr:sodium:calcium antiporter [Bacillota bacterium]MDI6906459.1 sodium:calcium antiporter [Thermoanaerobacterales bacterium]
MAFLMLPAALAVILLGARFFTNGVEWLGLRLGLARGAVGSVLAAIGTALPETMIPVVAIVLGRGEDAAQEVGVGAILGAPFMLSTMGFILAGLSAVILFRRGRGGRLTPQPALTRRDLGFFLGTYLLAIGSAFLPGGTRTYVVYALLGAYVMFLARALTQGEPVGEGGNGEGPGPLLVAPRLAVPPLWLILGQVIAAFLIVMGGAKVFVNSVADMASGFGVAPLVFSMLVAPVATELPELCNSVIWIRERKDTLALGNITGAMVFQGSIVPCVGIAFTNWELTPAAMASAGLAVISAFLAYWFIGRRGYLNGWLLIGTGALFYGLFVAAVTTGRLA